ncbi:MAG: DNA cytosine methyltransferase [Anaerolineaceae bacterium]|nr:DNA cytosine methyltransferase [Anaerolineaceae bacterium]
MKLPEHYSHPVAVDLFCGAGGLSYGMQRAGISISGGIDIDPACKYPFETNVKSTFHLHDVAELSSDFVASLFPRGQTRILAGCAPCQPFSTYTQGSTGGKRQWELLPKFGEIVREIQPEVVTMENVPRLTAHPVFEEFLNILDLADYQMSHQVVRCADYGVPQTRSRLVLLASRLGDIQLLPPTHTDDGHLTVRDTIQHLDNIDAGAASAFDPLHRSSGLSKRNLLRIRQSKPGGTWRDWDDSLRAECHIRESGRTYPGVYGRMQWDRPAPTMTTQFHGFGSGRFGHPEEDRAISLREGALLQTFPKDYSFVPAGDRIHMTSVARLIGNAVPVKLGEAIGRSIMVHLEELQ